MSDRTMRQKLAEIKYAIETIEDTYESDFILGDDAYLTIAEIALSGIVSRMVVDNQV